MLAVVVEVAGVEVEVDVVVVVVVAGSIDSGAPVMERKDVESKSWDEEVMATWGLSACLPGVGLDG